MYKPVFNFSFFTLLINDTDVFRSIQYQNCGGKLNSIIINILICCFLSRYTNIQYRHKHH